MMPVNVSKLSKRTQGWICIITGLIVGTVFTFGMQYWNSPITKNEAMYTETVFFSYEEVYKNGSINELIIHFENYDNLSIHNTCCSQQVIDGIHSLKQGDKLKIYYHPKSGNIMELLCNEKVILQFEDASQRLSRDRQGFTALGIFMYAAAVFGVVILIKERKVKKVR
ncbi:MAG TPA: hypothetical protein DCS04_03480 [Ruminococcaceae bacterium]|nr:hypothetical protein [Oscillospiraceae bacterium]